MIDLYQFADANLDNLLSNFLPITATVGGGAEESFSRPGSDSVSCIPMVQDKKTVDVDKL